MSKEEVKELWEGMPEFEQEKQEAYATIIVRVPDAEKLRELSEALGQPLTEKTKSVWFPKLVRGLNRGKMYVDALPPLKTRKRKRSRVRRKVIVD